jgi:hypothetical protein
MTAGAVAVFGPREPTLDDLAREYPRWHSWEGINGRFYARLLRSSPAIVVGSSTALGLRERIRDQAGQVRK